MKPIIHDREDTCPVCHSKRSIEAYSRIDKPIRLSLCIDRNLDVSVMDIKYLKCTNCKRQFKPMWLTKYPTPMLDSNYEMFLSGYKECLKQ